MCEHYKITEMKGHKVECGVARPKLVYTGLTSVHSIIF